eukprot:TRINITY_DN558_c0_g4_i2.p1 TRINITY_DN558_c0_g4~~TRINITY_DN558_c0_g4_i2.p1  ORF type:complete len:241 (+),score=99.79 TRINITY_DN558_c0_g4_i2:63-785(+)
MRASEIKLFCEVAAQVDAHVTQAADAGDVWLEKWKRCNKAVPLTVFDATRRVPLQVDKFLMRFCKYTGTETTVLLHAALYLERAVGKQRLRVTHFNKFRLLLAAVVVAEKYLKDAFLLNTYYAKVCGITVSELNVIEREFLLAIDWNLFVEEHQLDACRARLARAVAADEDDDSEQHLSSEASSEEQAHTPSTVCIASPAPQTLPTPPACPLTSVKGSPPPPRPLSRYVFPTSPSCCNAP